MTYNFTWILEQLPTRMKGPSTTNNFGGENPFKVQLNFDIPLYEIKIGVDAFKKWLSLRA